MALTSMAGSTTYALVDATFVVTRIQPPPMRGDEGGTRQLHSSQPTTGTLTATGLAVGSYTVTLLDGWKLEREESSGNFVAVDAVLVSSNTFTVPVFSGQTTPVTFQFETNGMPITFAPGGVDIGFIVRSCDPQAPPGSELNVVANSGFESGTAGWTTERGTIGTSDVAHCGAASAQSQDGLLRFALPLPATPQSYLVSAWVRLATGAEAHAVRLEIKGTSASGSGCLAGGDSIAQNVPPGEWIHLSGALAAGGAGCDAVSLQLSTDQKTGLLIDDVYAVPQTPPPGAGSPPDTDELARQSVRAALAVAAIIERDTSCGFASSAVSATGTFNGASAGPATTYTTSVAGCAISFPVPTTLASDCTGAAPTIQGTFLVTGTRASTGRQTHNPADPVWPDRRAGVTLDLTIQFLDGAAIGTVPRLDVRSGIMKVRVRPEQVLSSRTGLCTIETPIAAIEALAWQNATVQLTTAQFTAPHTVETSMMSATRGPSLVGANLLGGTMTIDGVPRSIGSDGLGLDPGYAPAGFDQTWSCLPFIESTDPAACWPSPALAANVARALMRDGAAVVDALDSDTTCGLQSAPAAASATIGVGRSSGGAATETRTTTACTIDLPFMNLPDCNGTLHAVGGAFTATDTRSTTGMLTTSDVQPVLPVTRTGVRLSIPSAALDGFAAQAVDDNLAWFAATGVISTEVTDIGGESVSHPGVFAIRTPVKAITKLQASSISGYLVVGNRNRVDLAISDVSLSGRIGIYSGGGNDMQGSLAIDGFPIVLGTPSPPFDPTYTQSNFDDFYVCTPDLAAPVPPY